MVELEECPYCGFNAWWDTWQEIQIVEKNENKEKKMQGWQDKVIEPRKKMIKKDILKKVKELEEKDYYIQRCLRVKICPGCGRNIPEAIGTFFNCECGFST
jgi:hypothetical protein